MKVWKAGLVAVAALSLFGCGAKDDKASGDSKGKQLKIAVIPKAEAHIFWKTCQAGALTAEKELGVDVIWKGPDKPDDRNSQVQTVQNFAVKGVDAMAVAPVDGDVLTKPIESAAKEGIKMVVFDSGLKRFDKVESFVATDNYRGGVICGEHMAKLLGGKGKVIMMRMLEGSISTGKREQGFLDGLKKAGPNIELLSVNEYGGTSVGSGQKKAQLLLNKYAKDVDGIFTCNETTTEGMLLALNQQGLAGKVKFIGFDTNQALINGLKENKVHGLAVQSPFKMGYLAVKKAYEALKGEKIKKNVDTGVALITPENMNTAESKQILSPDISILNK